MIVIFENEKRTGGGTLKEFIIDKDNKTVVFTYESSIGNLSSISFISLFLITLLHFNNIYTMLCRS